MTNQEAFDCGVRCKNMDTETAQRTFYAAYGIRSTTMTVPSGATDDSTYEYWCPESDPPSDMMDQFWCGYDECRIELMSIATHDPDAGMFCYTVAEKQHYNRQLERVRGREGLSFRMNSITARDNQTRFERRGATALVVYWAEVADEIECNFYPGEHL